MADVIPQKTGAIEQYLVNVVRLDDDELLFPGLVLRYTPNMTAIVIMGMKPSAATLLLM